MRLWLWLLTASALLSLTACGAEPSSSQSEPMSYKDMKTMVIDILKTEDAQKALQESATSSTGNTGFSSKILSVQDQEQVRMAVKEVLVSPDYDKVIKTLMTDTRFAGEFAKTVNTQNKQIHKDLIKDPSYQQDLIQAMKSPEMNKMILDVLQGSQYRKQVMSLMQEAMQNPLFRLEVLDLLKKAVQEELKPAPVSTDSKKKDESSGDSEDSGDDSSKEESDSEGGEEKDSAT